MNDWIHLSGPGEKCGGAWLHHSGWEVHHCGHPTANWPYYLVSPKNRRRIVIAHSGRGFKTLAAAQTVVKGLVSGYFRLSRGGTTVENATSFGDVI
jgi:hypothetical protein